MVHLSTLLLAATASISGAYPHKGATNNVLVTRAAPSSGDELTLRRTNNNIDEGSWTDDTGDVPIKVGDKIGEGSAGALFGVDCNGNADCEGLGPIALKYYLDNDQVEDERNHLAKIDELKAVLTSDSDNYTLLVRWEGTNFSQLPRYQELSQDPEGNKQAINDLVDSAVQATSDDALAYLRDHRIFHDDINDANVLMQESDSKITSAKLVDWDKASIIPSDISDEDWQALQDDVPNVVSTAFDRFRV